MNRYTTKRVTIKAAQWLGDTSKEAEKFISENELSGVTYRTDYGVCDLVISTLEGEMVGSQGDFVIKGLAGEYYPCKPEIFGMKYEAIE